MKVITISGPSGVGKTTVARLMSFLFQEKVTVVSGDSFHRWPRSSKRWASYTHLNPSANFLERAYRTVSSLKSGSPTVIREYDHSEGIFKGGRYVHPGHVIIYEGLHALYDDRLNRISDLKIYVDTPASLTREWKTSRDISARGYTLKQVEEQITRREIDEELYIAPQRHLADVVISFHKTSSGEISLQFEKGFVPELQKTFRAFTSFMNVARRVSSDISLTQGAGGNFSVKLEGSDKFFVKASGCKISDVDGEHGYVMCSRRGQTNRFTEDRYEDFLINAVLQGSGRPSMETGFHASLPYKVVLHTHPLYLNAILCSEESRELCGEILKEAEYIPYTTPGHKLHNRISDGLKKEVILLENHGLIIGADTSEKAVAKTYAINAACKEFLEKRKVSFVEHGHPASRPLFPDAAIFPESMKDFNDFILGLIMTCGLRPRFLTEKHVRELTNLKSEIYRKSK